MSTLAIRNCNPLNICHTRTLWKGEISPTSSLPPKQGDRGGLFCRFIDMSYGFRAAFVLLRTYMQKHHLYTIEKIIHRWAPPTENNTIAYIEFVCHATGIGGRELLTPTDKRLPELVWAMAIMEAGSQIKAYRRHLEAGWRMYLDES